MNVQETKVQILRRLDELREARERAPVVEVPRPRPPPRPRAKGWWRSRIRPDLAEELERRLFELELRLAAVEQGRPAGSGGNGVGRAGDTPRPDGPSGAGESSGTRGVDAAGGDLYEGLPYRLTGSAEDGLITDILQMIASNKKTGRFSLFVEDPKDRFDIFYREGKIFHAEAGDTVGDAAFFLMMVTAHRSGHYGFLETEELPETDDTISANTEFLILEALRRIDEEQNHGG